MTSKTPLYCPFWGIEKTYTRYNPVAIKDSPPRPDNTTTEAVAKGLYENKVPRDGGVGITIYIVEGEATPSNKVLVDISNDRLRELANRTFPDLEVKEPHTIHGNLVLNIAGGTKFGAAPKATIIPVRVKGDLGAAYADVLADVLNRNIQGRAILSISRGTSTANTDSHLESYEGISKLLEDGVVIVAAAGNDDVEIRRQDRDKMPQLHENYIKAMKAYKEQLKGINIKYPAANKAYDAQEARKTAVTAAYKPVKCAIDAVQATNLQFPSAHPGVIAVGGCDEKDGCERFAHGSGVDIYAPANRIPYFDNSGKIVDTCPPSTKVSTVVRGTSYATPFTAGTVATMMSERYKLQKNFEPWSRKDILDTLQRLARWRGTRYILCYPDNKTAADVKEGINNWITVRSQ